MSTIATLWALATLIASSLLLITTFSSLLWRRRKLGGECAAALYIAGLPFIIALDYHWIVRVVLALVHIWLVIIALRLVTGRLEEAFLRVSTQYNLLWALFLTMGILIAAYAPPALVTLLIVGTALGTAAYALGHVLWTFRHFAPHAGAGQKTAQLPTVSVCIPARNETHALADCLTAVLASNYPKLEVLVLDDCSQDKTSQIIRSFAHDGVRFVQGNTPADGWLGKNQALSTLAEHASGEWLLFMDTDTSLAPDSITQLVKEAMTHKTQMVSVLPQQRLDFTAATLLNTLRDFWQIALPVTPKRVPISSKAWLIAAGTLRELGGFASVRHKIVPEGSFARRLHSTGSYRFIISTAELGVTTAKRWSSQIETALRITYPTLKRQPVLALLAIAGITLCLLAPFEIMLAWAALNDYGPPFWLALAAASLWVIAYGLLLARTHPRSWWLSILCLPVVAAQEICLAVASMLQYEFGEVNWKGRNVCYPVLSVPPRGHLWRRP